MAASYAPWIQAMPSPHHISAEYARIPSSIAYPASEDVLSGLDLEILIMHPAFAWTASVGQLRNPRWNAQELALLMHCITLGTPFQDGK